MKDPEINVNGNKEELQKRMWEHAENLEFEEAAKIKKIKAIIGKLEEAAKIKGIIGK